WINKITRNTDSYVSLTNWSPHGTYAVLSGIQAKQAILQFWSTADWQLKSQYIGGIAIRTVAWDSLSRRLAFDWTDGNSQDLVTVVTPGTPKVVSLPLKHDSENPTIFWSPDNQNL